MANKKMSFVSTSSTIDIKTWSGTEYFVAKTLESHFEMDYVMGLKLPALSLAMLKKIYYKLLKENYSLTRSPEVAKSYARQAESKMVKNSDLVFSVSSIPIAYIDSPIPKAFYTDATFASMLNYYEEASGFCRKTIQEGMKLEQQALDSSSLVFYSSDWAAQSAIRDYGVSPDKVKVVPFGANIIDSYDYEDIKSFVSQKDGNICRILFLGVDWVRKRGDVVLQAVDHLHKMGLQVELHLVGVNNLQIEKRTYVFDHGFISKSTPDGMAKIEQLIRESHFLFLPSKMEAYGVVFCEAMSMAVLPVTCSTGGIPTIVKNGENGIILPQDACAEDFARAIYATFTDRTRYNQLALAAYDDYRERLNWKVACKTITGYLNEL